MVVNIYSITNSATFIVQLLKIFKKCLKLPKSSRNAKKKKFSVIFKSATISGTFKSNFQKLHYESCTISDTVDVQGHTL